MPVDKIDQDFNGYVVDDTGEVTHVLSPNRNKTPVALNNPTLHAAAHAAMGAIAASPAPTYSTTGKLLTMTIDSVAYVYTYDANDNIETETIGSIIWNYTWTLGSDGNWHVTSRSLA